MARADRRRASSERQLLVLAQFRLGTRLAREDLTALAQRLDDSPPWMDGDAAAEWKSAAVLHGTAQAALRDVRTLADVLGVHTILDRARFHLARADALAYDEDPPTSSTPCWFDPRHGPAAAEVDWETGRVQACREDADRLEVGLSPRRRLLRMTAFTDQSDTSPIQRHMEVQARGSGYALGALYAGSPHVPI